MSEPKLMNTACPKCGGKLQIKKGRFFTVSVCKECRMRLVWPEKKALTSRPTGGCV